MSLRRLFFLLIFAASGCSSDKIVPAAPSGLQTLEEFHLSDWKNNSFFETVQFIEGAAGYRGEAALYAVPESELEKFSSSGDPRFSLLENALAGAVAAIDRQKLPLLAERSRRLKTVSVLSEIGKFNALSAKNLAFESEKEDHELFLISANVVYGCDMKKRYRTFDPATLPGCLSIPKLRELPSWLEWNSKLPVRWANLLHKLPGELLRAPGVDRAGLSLLVMDITFRISARLAAEHLKKIGHALEISSDEREKIILCWQKHLMAEYMSLENLKTEIKRDELQQSEMFLKDIYALSR